MVNRLTRRCDTGGTLARHDTELARIGMIALSRNRRAGPLRRSMDRRYPRRKYCPYPAGPTIRPSAMTVTPRTTVRTGQPLRAQPS